ncbi:hypothetical protein VTN49DRAFT_5247 [Thermomyces lanuginosus]|uniref:uncharacterized protein n=1 Tax=Thermomyces lanuginosus TaxID=5541 RepID=UPI0037443E6F
MTSVIPALRTRLHEAGLAVRRWASTAASSRGPRHPNPGNFQNRPREEVQEIARKGGRKGGKAKGTGGFHNMDPNKQRAIASKGGRASSGSFTKGSAKAREAGRKGGRAKGRSPFDE